MNMEWKFIVPRSSLIAVLAIACANPQQAPHDVRRVVSLAPNVTEMLFACGCGPKVVATDNFSDYPEAVKRLPKVGGVEPDVERIAAMHPDLVIASSSNMHPNLRRALTAARLSLLVITTDRLADIAPAMQTIERKGGCGTVVTVNTALRQQRRVRPKGGPRVMFAVWTDPLYVAGRGTYVDDLLQLTGARNDVKAQGWPEESLETFVADPPDLLIYPDISVKKSAVDELIRRTGVKLVAVAVDEDTFARPGPRVVDAAAELNRILDSWEASHR
ncbi:MAG TPA: helical backbone metal receptor [Thermoanaerobaculia bacterium]|nr:helical backbone metal receptor [Thermoanaerobaculia bacterium]